MTTSKDVLEAISSGAGPKKVLVTLGYSGWGAGQLEEEMSRNGWINVDAEPGIIFDTPVEPALRQGAVAARHRREHAQLGRGARVSGAARSGRATSLLSRFRLRRPPRRRRHRQLADANGHAAHDRRRRGRGAHGSDRCADRRMAARRRSSSACRAIPTAQRTRTPSGRAASARQLQARFGLPVHEVDERYTTTDAKRAGRGRPRRRCGGDHPRTASGGPADAPRQARRRSALRRAARRRARPAQARRRARRHLVGRRLARRAAAARPRPGGRARRDLERAAPRRLLAARPLGRRRPHQAAVRDPGPAHRPRRRRALHRADDPRRRQRALRLRPAGERRAGGARRPRRPRAADLRRVRAGDDRAAAGQRLSLARDDVGKFSFEIR